MVSARRQRVCPELPTKGLAIRTAQASSYIKGQARRLPWVAGSDGQPGRRRTAKSILPREDSNGRLGQHAKRHRRGSWPRRGDEGSAVRNLLRGATRNEPIWHSRLLLPCGGVGWSVADRGAIAGNARAVVIRREAGAGPHRRPPREAGGPGRAVVVRQTALAGVDAQEGVVAMAMRVWRGSDRAR